MSCLTCCRMTLDDFRKLGNIRKISKVHGIIAQCSVLPRNENFAFTSKNLKFPEKLNFSHSALFHMKTRICLRYFVSDYSFHAFYSNIRNMNAVLTNRIADILLFNNKEIYTYVASIRFIGLSWLYICFTACVFISFRRIGFYCQNKRINAMRKFRSVIICC